MDKSTSIIWKALDRFKIETPSWGYGDTGTRFGTFYQPAAAITLEDKLRDAGMVHRLTGCCPMMAVSQLDIPKGCDLHALLQTAFECDIKIGSINPILYQDQCYKYGSLGNPDSMVRCMALNHILGGVDLMNHLNSRFLSLWFPDGSNYPGQDDIIRRKHNFTEGLRKIHAKLKAHQTMLIEYKPFEPAFYHTDIGDWGMAYLLAKASGRRAKVLVDTGHHFQAQNIEQIVAWLLDEDMLGGFHFNDRRYADDDLALGSIDPYQIFRIFHEMFAAEQRGKRLGDIVFMIDQNHNLKSKVEEMIQTVTTGQELWAKAALVDHGQLARHQWLCHVIDAENCLRSAFATDVRPTLAAWRRKKGLPPDPLAAFRQSGYEKQAGQERSERRRAMCPQSHAPKKRELAGAK